jgi:hypothetical protein
VADDKQLRALRKQCLITGTVVLKPVFVAAFRINLTTLSRQSNITPSQAPTDSLSWPVAEVIFLQP